jgi:hypothetical protein
MARFAKLAAVYFAAVILFTTLNFRLAGQEPEPIREVILKEFPPILLANPLELSPKDDELTKLMKSRYNAARDVAREAWANLGRDGFGCEPLLNAGRRLQQAGMDLRKDPKEKLEVLKEMAEFSNKLEARTRKTVSPYRDLKKINEFRLEVAIERVKIENSLKKAPAKESK